MIRLDSHYVRLWKRHNGDVVHNLNYQLDSNSVVIDIGGYTGQWAEQIVKLYNSKVYIVEPVPDFYQVLEQKFGSNPNVTLLNAGASNENKTGTIFFNNDGSSSSHANDTPIAVEFRTVDSILNQWGIDQVDLVQINIEGEEYPLLEYMLEHKLLSKFKNIQIQFHLGIDDAEAKRDRIRQGLADVGFVNKFDYPFVWEAWHQ